MTARTQIQPRIAELLQERGELTSKQMASALGYETEFGVVSALRSMKAKGIVKTLRQSGSYLEATYTLRRRT